MCRYKKKERQHNAFLSFWEIKERKKSTHCLQVSTDNKRLRMLKRQCSVEGLQQFTVVTLCYEIISLSALFRFWVTHFQD